MKSRSILTIVAATSGFALAACSITPSHPGATGHQGSGHSSATTHPTSPTTSTPSTTTTSDIDGQCSFNDLAVNFGPPNGAAGHTYFAVDFRNIGAAACTLYGFPGVSFLNASNAVIGSVTSREGNETPTTVNLQPGGFAVASLAVTDPSIPPCSGNAVASSVRVYPPGSFSADFIPITGVSVCSSASTASYQDSFVAPIESANSSNEGSDSYSTCAVLDVSLGQSGAGLGHIGEPIVFQNTGSTTCTMYGYPLVKVTSNGLTSGTDDTPNGYLGGLSGSTIPMVNLAPGATASALVEGTDNPVGTATSCPTYSSLEITPPGDSQVFTLDTSLLGCSTIEVHPVVSGSTGQQS